MIGNMPACAGTTDKHCAICRRASALICCECGNALTPWHPDIEGLWKDKEFSEWMRT